MGGTLRDCARANDQVARVGGDEFLVLLPGTDERGGRRYASPLRRALHRAVPEGDLQPSVSIGVAAGQEGDLIADVLKKADQHMYRDKRSRPQAPVADG